MAPSALNNCGIPVSAAGPPPRGINSRGGLGIAPSFGGAPQVRRSLRIAELLKRAGAVSSTSEAKRMIEQGAVSIDGQKVSDFNLKLAVKKGSLLKAGKKKFVKLI